MFIEASFIQVYAASEGITYVYSLEGRGPKLVLLDIDLGVNSMALTF